LQGVLCEIVAYLFFWILKTVPWVASCGYERLDRRLRKKILFDYFVARDGVGGYCQDLFYFGYELLLVSLIYFCQHMINALHKY
jgi:hypothetical protein